MKKGEPATNDQLVTIDFKNKKIINSPGGLAREIKIDNWSEKYISWRIERKADKVSFIYRLDRVSGKLEEIYLDEIQKDQIKTFYIFNYLFVNFKSFLLELKGNSTNIILIKKHFLMLE